MALLTGSRAYGTPHKDSDTDIVILVTKEDLKSLRKFYKGGYAHGRMCVKSGDLNLIVETDPDRYALWEAGTALLKTKAPVSREDAIDKFVQLGVTKPLDEEKAISG